MFSTALNCVEPYAGNSFYDTALESYVDGNDYCGDMTGIATLRCLLYPRDCSGYFVRYRQVNTSFDYTLYLDDAKTMFSKINGDRFSEVPDKTLLIYSSTRNIVAICDAMETAKNNPWNNEHKVDRNLPIEKYLQSKIVSNIRVYVFPEINSCVIFTESINLRINHLLLSFMPIYFPGIFKEKPISQEEKDMLHTLALPLSDSYINAIWKLAEQTDINERVMTSGLSSIQKAAAKRIVEEKEGFMEKCRTELDNIGTRYEEMLRQLTSATIEYEGAVVMASRCGEAKELVEYFKSHKNVRLISVDNTYMKIIITGFIDSFDAAGYEHISKNDEFYLHYNVHSGPFKEAVNRKLLMDHLFNEMPELKIKSCSMFTLDLAGGVRTESGYNFSKFHQCDNHMPNPHFQRHACIGGNRPLIADQLQKGEIIGALECCVAAASAVNIHETTATFRPFMQDVFLSNNPILFNAETNEDMTPEQALEWIKSKDAEKEKE